MWEATFEKGSDVRTDAATGRVERWAVKVWPWDLPETVNRSPDAPWRKDKTLKRFDGNALVAFYPIRVVSDRAPSTLQQIVASSPESTFVDFAIRRPSDRLTKGDFEAPSPMDVDSSIPGLDVGSTVALVNLKRGDLNGKRGKVETPVNPDGRVGVRATQGCFNCTST